MYICLITYPTGPKQKTTLHSILVIGSVYAGRERLRWSKWVLHNHFEVSVCKIKYIKKIKNVGKDEVRTREDFSTAFLSKTLKGCALTTRPPCQILLRSFFCNTDHC